MTGISSGINFSDKNGVSVLQAVFCQCLACLIFLPLIKWPKLELIAVNFLW